jgi:MFS family permease
MIVIALLPLGIVLLCLAWGFVIDRFNVLVVPVIVVLVILAFCALSVSWTVLNL